MTIQQNSLPRDVDLNVPYKDKSEAKTLGARWSPGTETWYVPPNVDLSPFLKRGWIRSGQDVQDLLPSPSTNSLVGAIISAAEDTVDDFAEHFVGEFRARPHDVERVRKHGYQIVKDLANMDSESLRNNMKTICDDDAFFGLSIVPGDIPDSITPEWLIDVVGTGLMEFAALEKTATCDQIVGDLLVAGLTVPWYPEMVALPRLPVSQASDEELKTMLAAVWMRNGRRDAGWEVEVYGARIRLVDCEITRRIHGGNLHPFHEQAHMYQFIQDSIREYFADQYKQRSAPTTVREYVQVIIEAACTSSSREVLTVPGFRWVCQTSPLKPELRSKLSKAERCWYPLAWQALHDEDEMLWHEVLAVSKRESKNDHLNLIFSRPGDDLPSHLWIIENILPAILKTANRRDFGFDVNHPYLEYLDPARLSDDLLMALCENGILCVQPCADEIIRRLQTMTLQDEHCDRLRKLDHPEISSLLAATRIVESYQSVSPEDIVPRHRNRAAHESL